MRTSLVKQHFPTALGVDDYLARVEILLGKSGFTGENSITVLNLCRDEVTNPLKRKVQTVFGEPFNVHGLGGVLTCGVTGMKAGLSHAPVVQAGGREKYIFFSFPHIAIDSCGEPGKISRAARPGSHACGALLKVLGELNSHESCVEYHEIGEKEEHDAMDPEYSILKHRLERRIAAAGLKHVSFELVSLTSIAEQAITEDLETLISQSIDTSKADYAVVTGIQIHNWVDHFEDGEEPNLDYMKPSKCYTVINGIRKDLDLNSVMELTPRMIRSLMAARALAPSVPLAADPVVNNADTSLMPKSKAYRRQFLLSYSKYEQMRKALEGGSADGSDKPAAEIMDSSPEAQAKLPKELAVRRRDAVHGPCFHVPTLAELQSAEKSYFALRQSSVKEHFPTAMGVDDYLARVEIMLCNHGFTGESSISVLNLCRDEICNSLKTKVQNVFGEVFNIHGLGGVVTCGVTGLKASFSHAPLTNPGGREKYIFFSFPHIAIDSRGEPGHINRAARPESHACGALLKVLGDLKTRRGKICHTIGDKEEHDAMDPEYSILKQRMEQRIATMGLRHVAFELVSLTSVAEQAITQDLEALIRSTIDVNKADYAVVTGIQIHNWVSNFDGEEPNLEFIKPCNTYMVVNGQRKDLNINSISALTPRMIRYLIGSCYGGHDSSVENTADDSAIPRSRRRCKQALITDEKYERLLHAHDEADASQEPGPNAKKPRLDDSDAHVRPSVAYMAMRQNVVREHFANAVGVDDYMTKAEMLLSNAGFTGETSIAVLNLCRDEICNSLKRRIQSVFGETFNTHGLGGILTCGVIGLKAGLSHAPMAPEGGREKYVFFSFPHIAIDASGEPGLVSRAARPGSHACGALLKALSDLKEEECCGLEDGAHDVMNPEYSILRKRLEKHLSSAGLSAKSMDLVSLTNAAEKAITTDLEGLISNAVDTTKADYAVFSGIQVHNWASNFDSDEPNLEFISPCQSYVVVNGQKQELDINSVSGLTPRMLNLLSGSVECVHGPAVPAIGGAVMHAGDNPMLPRSQSNRRDYVQVNNMFRKMAVSLPAPLD